MARKTRGVTDEILQKVIALRTTGSSWMKIQGEVGIDRRTAKRVYEQWEHSQTKEELTVARQNVAADEFRNHLLSLIKLAQSLIETLAIPKLLSERRNANDLLMQLWQRNIVGEFGAYELLDAKVRDRYIFRQNQLLFKSLQTHTQGKIDWDVLEHWGKSWNRCVSALAELEEAGRGILWNIFEQKPYLKHATMKETNKKNIIEVLLEGILHIVWLYILNGSVSKSFPIVKTAHRSNVLTEVLFGEDSLVVGITFRETESAKEMVVESKRAAIGLSKGNSAVELTTEIKKIQSIIDGLAESLNPLFLKPLILHTRCDLCPA